VGYYTDVVETLQWAVMHIQQSGMCIDMPLARELYQVCERKQTQIEQAFGKALGYALNPNSPKQVLDLFCNDFKINLQDSSDKLALRKTQIEYPEATPVIDAILAYRDLGKKKGTYLRPSPWPDGRVRSQFRTYGTLTWRLSSREPDLQNLPRRPTHGINIKNIYVAAPGRVLVEVDKNQLEYRIPAYASNCANLIRVFESGDDVHLYNATSVFGRDIREKSSKERDYIKRLKYSEQYGAGNQKISDTMLVETGEYQSPTSIGGHLLKLRAAAPEMYTWRDECLRQAEGTGRVWDGFGTPRLLYDNPKEYRQVAYSWPTQATASGVINRATIRVYCWLIENRLPIKIVCQIHDSLIFEMWVTDVYKYLPTIMELMDQPEFVFERWVTFPSEAKIGFRLGEMKAA